MTVVSEGLEMYAAEPESYSPFAEYEAAPVVTEATEVSPETSLESPFEVGSGGQPETGSTEMLAEVASQFLEDLADEDFTSALQALVDEGAARHVTDLGAWSATPGPGEGEAMLEEWLAPLAGESQRVLGGLSEQLAGVDPTGMSERELGELFDAAVERLGTAPEAAASPVFEQFFSSLLNKARKLVTGTAALIGKGAAALGRFMPVGLLLNQLKKLVPGLFKGVLRAMIGKLPVAVQPIARTLASKLGLAEASTSGATESGPWLTEAPVGEQVAVSLAESFDREVASLLLAPSPVEPEADHEAPGQSERAAADPVGELDVARARLAEQLVELPPGVSPAPEIEQFIPVVMAVRPLVKLGISLIGRDKVVGFVADRVAELIKGMVGADSASKLARPLVDVGLHALGFEAAPSAPLALAGEALASTVEGTVDRLLEMPAETFADELLLDSAIQQSFAEAAAAFMPDQLLRADLPERETAGEGGVWILMPRSARPRFRCRRFSRTYAVPISRQTARSIRWSDGGTLETYLLDRGAEHWPVAAEVDLFEALPGSQPGHLAASAESEALEGDHEGAAGLQPLSSEAAGLLLREPGLGRPSRPTRQLGRSHHAHRYFRVRPVGLPGRVERPRHRVVVWFDLAASEPRIRVALRMTERQGQQLLTKLAAGNPPGRDLAGALAELRSHYQLTLPAKVVGRLLRAGVASNAEQAGPIADRVTTAVGTALSGFLAQRSSELTAAVRDPANGLTITITFPGVTKQSLATTLPAGQVTAVPGWPPRG